MKFILETERLGLRQMSFEDLDFVATMFSDPDVTRFISKAATSEKAEEWIYWQQKRYERDGHGLWLTIEKRTEQPVGQVGLLMQEVDGFLETEISYILHKPFWRRGFATEAAVGVRDYAFHTLHKHRLISLIVPDNSASEAVAKRIGMSLEREVVVKDWQLLLFSLADEGQEVAS